MFSICTLWREHTEGREQSRKRTLELRGRKTETGWRGDHEAGKEAGKEDRQAKKGRSWGRVEEWR